MKVGEIFEMSPLYNPIGEPPPKYWKSKFDIFISTNALKRSYTKIGEFEINIEGVSVLEFYFMDEGKIVYGGYQTLNEETDIFGFKAIFILEFKSKITLVNYPKDIKKKILLQVNKVNTVPRLRNIGIASFVYQLLILKGFTVLSDVTQLDGGKALWIKMARRSHLTNYKIRILDNEDGYLKDGQNETIEYDGSNIEEAKIWTHDQDFSGEHILLIMSEK